MDNEGSAENLQTLLNVENSRFRELHLFLFKASPRHRFVTLYDDNIPLLHYGSRVKPVILKIKSCPAFDMLFLLCFLKKTQDKEWVDAEFLSRIYFGDEVSLDTIHNYMESKLRGTLRKALKKVFGIDVTDFIAREDHHYHLALSKENIDIDKSVLEFGVPQEGDKERDARFKNLMEGLSTPQDVTPKNWTPTK